MDFPGGSDGKAFVYNVRDLGLIPVLGRFPGKWQPTPVLLPWKSHGWRSLVQATIHGVAKSRARLSDWTELTTYRYKICRLPTHHMCSDNTMGKVTSTGKRCRVLWRTLARNADSIWRKQSNIAETYINVVSDTPYRHFQLPKKLQRGSQEKELYPFQIFDLEG